MGGGGDVPQVPGLPGDVSWLKGIAGEASVAADGTLTMTSGPETDYFNAPPMPGMPSGLANAPALMAQILLLPLPLPLTGDDRRLHIAVNTARLCVCRLLLRARIRHRAAARRHTQAGAHPGALAALRLDG